MSSPNVPEATIVPVATRLLSANLVARVTQAVSHAASPPVLSLVGLAIAASNDGAPTAWRAAGAVAIAGVLLPMALTVALLWRGRVSDIEISSRRERLGPLLLTTICFGTASVVVQSFGAPPAVVGLSCILGVQAFVTLLVSLCWKISLHCLSAATVGGLVWCLWGEPLPLLIIVPVMIWSRLYLKRHTLAQTIAGSALGVSSILTLWPLLVG
jgi:membrane-associated phospholipid phosphatase